MVGGELEWDFEQVSMSGRLLRCSIWRCMESGLSQNLD